MRFRFPGGYRSYPGTRNSLKTLLPAFRIQQSTHVQPEERWEPSGRTDRDHGFAVFGCHRGFRLRVRNPKTVFTIVISFRVASILSSSRLPSRINAKCRDYFP